MARSRPEPELPPCYAMVFPGLEEIAGEEITRDLGGEVRKIGPECVIFRVDPLDKRVLELRTTEDVFLLAWGTDQLTHRAVDLEKIERWTAREPDWENLLRLPLSMPSCSTSCFPARMVSPWPRNYALPGSMSRC